MDLGGDVEKLGCMSLAESGRRKRKKRVKGIEPSPKAWEAFILPLNYTRDLFGESTNWLRMGQAGSSVIASTGINQDQLGV